MRRFSAFWQMRLRHRLQGQKSKSRGGAILWRPPSRTACLWWRLSVLQLNAYFTWVDLSDVLCMFCTCYAACNVISSRRSWLTIAPNQTASLIPSESEYMYQLHGVIIFWDPASRTTTAAAGSAARLVCHLTVVANIILIQARSRGGGGDGTVGRPYPPGAKVTLPPTVRALTSWTSSVYEIELIKSSRL